MIAWTVPWAVSPAVALVSAVLFAFAWLLLATATADVPPPARTDNTEVADVGA